MNEIIDIYNSTSEEEKEKIISGIKSTTQVETKSNKTVYDDTWLVKMEETVRYLDNILRNPNRFIVNEEEIVKVELARRITVESIKHLSRNTNLIQKYDPKTGEVKPSKILNINKEESFNTYENRFIHTLINNMKMYINRKKTEQISNNSSSDDIDIKYQGKTTIKKEDININLNITSHSQNNNKNADDINQRIAKVEQQIQDLCHQEVYKSIDRLHTAPVTSPIKKTNLILKNVNFQYALDLWNYLQLNMESSTKKDKENKSYEDNGKLKQLFDESFTLNYLIMKTIKESKPSDDSKELQGKVINNTINQLLELKNDLTEEELKKLVGDEYRKVKYKKVLDTSIIETTYKKAINEYINKNHDLKVKKNEKHT